MKNQTVFRLFAVLCLSLSFNVDNLLSENWGYKFTKISMTESYKLRETRKQMYVSRILDLLVSNESRVDRRVRIKKILNIMESEFGEKCTEEIITAYAKQIIPEIIKFPDMVKYFERSPVIKKATDEYFETIRTLIKAIERKDLETVKSFINLGISPNAELESFEPLLYTASSIGDLPTVKYLVEQGADIEKEFFSALIVAAEEGHLPVVKYLVEKGADLNFKYIFSGPALTVAAEKGHLPVVKYLVAKGADIDEKGYSGTLLRHAVMSNDLTVVKYVLSLGVDVNEKIDEKSEFFSDMTILDSGIPDNIKNLNTFDEAKINIIKTLIFHGGVCKHYDEALKILNIKSVEVVLKMIENESNYRKSGNTKAADRIKTLLKNKFSIYK